MNSLSKATLGRLPAYLKYIRTVDGEHISSASIAKALGFGEVQVRKDLAAVSGKGKPKIGYETKSLLNRLECCLGLEHREQAILAGAGKLGRTLLDYDGFADYGVEISAAFDCVKTMQLSEGGKPIYPIEEMQDYCFRNGIRIGILTVPGSVAQEVCDLMVKSNISAVWSFAPVSLKLPENVVLLRENLALSLAHLQNQLSRP